MKGMRNMIWATLLIGGFSGSAQADVIDNSAWDGSSINHLWDQSAQTLSFSSDTTLNSFGWWLGGDHTHEVSVVEWSSGPGSALFSSTQAWTSGFNQINPNVLLTSGVTYAVMFNYLGSTEYTHLDAKSGALGCANQLPEPRGPPQARLFD
jgi:hypothetical protein